MPTRTTPASSTDIHPVGCDVDFLKGWTFERGRGVLTGTVLAHRGGLLGDRYLLRWWVRSCDTGATWTRTRWVRARRIISRR